MPNDTAPNTHIAISADHAGYDLKTAIIAHFSSHSFVDLGTQSAENRCDYPDQADLLAETVHSNADINFGILICGSGIGISIAGNRHRHLRVALCHNALSAQLAREHNDANVLALGARLLSQETAFDAVQSFLATNFAAGRHLARVEKLY